MAKLYFKFGAMGSSKTAQALMTKFNYEEKGRNVWLIKPAVDTRDDCINSSGKQQAMIRSRIGLCEKVDIIHESDNISTMFSNLVFKKPDVIICDECQFLTAEQVEQLRDIADIRDIPVICFGLKTDFTTHLFAGSKRLLEIADSISEIKSICRCGNKAVVNARITPDGKIITYGDQIQMGGNEAYEGMCYRCWLSRQNEKTKEERL